MIEVRQLSPAQLPEFVRVHSTAFSTHRDESAVAEVVEMLGSSSNWGAFLDGEMVGTATDWATELTLPGGGTAPMAAITLVGVLPTARRRGAMRALVETQIESFRESGVPLAGLHASESTIYGRFGFGAATTQLVRVEVDRCHAGLLGNSGAGGRVRLLDHAGAADLLPIAHDRARLGLPGDIARHPDFWKYHLSPGRGENRYRVVFESATGGLDGFAIYTVERRWEDGVACGVVDVDDLVWATPEAYAGLLRYLLGIDLMRTVRLADRPLDEPLRWLLADPRHARMGPLSDGLWVRLLDLRAAFAARRYAADGRLSFEVLRVEGGAERLVLEADGGVGSCAAGGADADLVLGEGALAAAYLGGHRLRSLAAAGLVEERATGALARGDLMLQPEREPWCSVAF